MKPHFRTALLLVVVSLPPTAAPADALADLDRIARTYRIEIVTADPVFPVGVTHGRIDGRRASKKEIETYADLFVAEFGLYPAALIRRAHLQRVVLCRELSFAGQRRSAIPDFEHDTLYLDVASGTHSIPYLRKVIHHEFFHIIDFRDDGLLYADERWAALNPAGFQYGNGGRAVQDLPKTSLLTDQFPGFLNHYSTTGVEEDKAEVFANLIVDREYVEDRARNDRVLGAKVERMKELLARFCPEMNDQFWQKIRKVKRLGK